MKRTILLLALMFGLSAMAQTYHVELPEHIVSGQPFEVHFVFEDNFNNAEFVFNAEGLEVVEGTQKFTQSTVSVVSGIMSQHSKASWAVIFRAPAKGEYRISDIAVVDDGTALLQWPEFTIKVERAPLFKNKMSKKNNYQMVRLY